MTEERKIVKKIRITKLQEAQLEDVVRINEACAAMYWEAGFTEEQVPAHNSSEIARLTRSADVLVAEADDEPAAYLVWADQAPGIAWMPAFCVAPDYQRQGVGTRLLREVGEVAGGHGIKAVVTPIWERASWAMAFCGVRGFQPLEGHTGIDTLETWRNDKAADLTLPGQKLWWAKTDGLGLVPGLPRPS